jgi:nitrogen fixation protein FixH
MNILLDISSPATLTGSSILLVIGLFLVIVIAAMVIFMAKKDK